MIVNNLYLCIYVRTTNIKLGEKHEKESGLHAKGADRL